MKRTARVKMRRMTRRVKKMNETFDEGVVKDNLTESVPCGPTCDNFLVVD